MWQASATTTFATIDRQDPDVDGAIKLGFDVVRRDAIGESRRAELGADVFVVREHHAPGGQTSRRIGVLLRVGRTFFLYLLTSARAGNLWAATTDREGNAATEIISTVIRVMTDFGRSRDVSYRPHLFAREHERIVRDERHGADLKQTLVACRTFAHIPNTMDLARRQDSQMFTFGSMLAANNAAAVITGMNRAEVVIQANGGFYEDIKLAPFTHGAAVEHERDARTGAVVTTTDKHRLAVVEDVDAAKRRLRQLVDCILQSAKSRDSGRCDWHAVGALMAELGLLSRLPANRKKGLLVRDTDPAGWASAAHSLFQSRWIDGWKTGSFTKDVRLKIELELDGLDLAPVKTVDGKSFVPCQIDMPLPEGGWGVTDEEWDRVLALRYPADRKPRVHTGEVLPFAGLPAWQSDRGLFKVVSRSARYNLHVGPERAGGLAWDKWRRTSDHIATIRPEEWHQDVARAAEAALRGIADQVLPLWVDHSTGGGLTSTGSAVDPLAALNKRLEAAESRADAALDTYNERRAEAKASPSSDSDHVTRAHRALERAEALVRELNAEMRTVELEPAAPEPVESEALAETATVEFVIAALSLCVGQAPGWLQRACSILLRDVRIEPAADASHAGRRQLSWTCTLVVPVRTADGFERQVGLPLVGTIFDRANRTGSTDGTPAPGPESWAWHYFYNGAAMADIAAASGGIDGSGRKNSYLYKGLAGWAAGAVGDTTLINALLDCPVPETRRVIWWMVTGDESSVRGIDEGFVRHIAKTYGAPSRLQTWGWCHDAHDLARSVSDYLVHAGGDATLLELSTELGVSYERLLALTRVNGKGRSGEVKVRARLAVAPFERNWARCTRWIAAEDKRLSLRECPHPDCPERLRGRRPFASHVLATPETITGQGVLCPSCRRLPMLELGDVRFPAAYLRPWSGRYGTRTKPRQRQLIGTHLDPSRPDPGPGVGLPDTGARPRVETRVNVPGNYVPKAVRATQLGGRRVLVVGVDDMTGARLHNLIEASGGAVATKLNATVACVVTPTDVLSTHYPRIEKAVGMGIPVFTTATFTSKLREGWQPAPR